jgi:hypothetical protein
MGSNNPNRRGKQGTWVKVKMDPVELPLHVHHAQGTNLPLYMHGPCCGIPMLRHGCGRRHGHRRQVLCPDFLSRVAPVSCTLDPPVSVIPLLPGAGHVRCMHHLSFGHPCRERSEVYGRAADTTSEHLQAGYSIYTQGASTSKSHPSSSCPPASWAARSIIYTI